MAQTGPIAIYGATGYTGRLVTAEAIRRGLDVIISGRNPQKLRALAAGHGGVPCKTAALEDRGALRHLLGDCAAVINCAGPFIHFGEPVLRAAVQTGTHYLDTTGEQTWMARVFEQFDDAAQAAEVAVIPAMGFDYVPGDLIAGLAARGHEPLAELIVAYVPEGVVPTRGTMHTTLEMLRSGDLVYEDGGWRPAPSSRSRVSFNFPPPIGRRAMTRYPSGEVVTIPRHVRTRKVTSLIDAAMFVPHETLAPLVGLSLPALRMALKTPAKAGIDAVIDRLPEGPTDDQRAAARFTVVALARGEDGRTGRAIARGSDVYGLTAVTTVQGAELVSDPSYHRAGALAPSSAFDATGFLDALAPHGLSYEAAAAVPT